MDVAPNALELAVGTGPVVKFVLLILVVASVMSWTIIFSKWFSFKQATKHSKNFFEMFWNGTSLDKIFSDSKDFSASPVSNIFRAGFLEFQKVSAKSKDKGKLSPELATVGIDNLQRSLRKASKIEQLRLERMIPVLASIASVAPFIGLFGTVWGIMNSFQMLGLGGPSTLKSVAPGISEALIATAVGLAAAIPAVIFYNIYVNRVRSFKADMDNFSSDFTNIIERNYLGS